jgi:hypothetical protein
MGVELPVPKLPETPRPVGPLRIRLLSSAFSISSSVPAGDLRPANRRPVFTIVANYSFRAFASARLIFALCP